MSYGGGICFGPFLFVTESPLGFQSILIDTVVREHERPKGVGSHYRKGLRQVDNAMHRFGAVRIKKRGGLSMGRCLLCVSVLVLVLQISTGTAHAIERPFKVTVSVAFTSPSSSFVFPVVGTHIGMGSFAGGPTASFVGIPPWAAFANCFTSVFPFVLTASAGDQIFGQVLNLQCHTAFSPPLSSVLSGFYQITGGTGRFLNASGSGFISSAIEIPGTGTATLEGAINY
jgi:hypothetical protein